jgi:hypothetical protein
MLQGQVISLGIRLGRGFGQGITLGPGHEIGLGMGRMSKPHWKKMILGRDCPAAVNG